MDYLGAIGIILGALLIIMGIGMIFDIKFITAIIDAFFGVVAIIVGLVLLVGGAKIIKDDE